MYHSQFDTFKDCERILVSTPNSPQNKLPEFDCARRTMKSNFRKETLLPIAEGSCKIQSPKINSIISEESSQTTGSFKKSVNLIEKKEVKKRKRANFRRLDLSRPEDFRFHYKEIIEKKDEVNKSLQNCHDKIIHKLKNTLSPDSIWRLRHKLSEIIDDTNMSILLNRKKKK